MKKKMTDNELQRAISEIAELFPAIDPGDAEWREFMRDFIAARPGVKIDKDFSAALRTELLLRGEILDAQPKRKSNWLPMVGMFFSGAAVCAVVVVPMLMVPQKFETTKSMSADVQMDEAAPMANRAMLRGGQPKMALMARKEMAPAVANFAMEDEMVVAEHLDVAAGTLNSDFGEAPMMNLQAEPMMLGGAANSRMAMRMPEQLAWEDAPSDEAILAVAIEFFDQHNFDELNVSAPYIDKWWENGIFEAERPEFAPERLGVVFAGKNGLEDVRMDIDLRNLRVVWMTYSFSRR